MFYFFELKWCQVKTFSCVVLAMSLIQNVLCVHLSVHFHSGQNENFIENGELFCSSLEHNRTCCYGNEFQCGDGTCIPLSKVCELEIYDPFVRYMPESRPRKYDCRDASDELGCAFTPCNARTSACDQTCIDLPGTNKSRCACYKGYYLHHSDINENEAICEDIDECLIGEHSCSHHCINLNGSFACDCKEGFNKTNVRGACNPEDENISLFYTSNQLIYMYHAKSNISKLIFYARDILGMDIDPINEILYWSDKSGVFRTYIPGAKQGNVSVAVIQPFINNILRENIVRYNLIVDWKLQNMYWLSPDVINNNQSFIMASKLDGRYVKTMATIPQAHNLLLVVKQGYLFWLSNGRDNSSIIQGTLINNPSYKNWDIYKFAYGSISVMAFDNFFHDRIYLADEINYTIYYVNHMMKRLSKVIKVDSRRFPVSMDVSSDFLYWVTRESGELLRVNKFGKANIEIVIKNLVKPTLVKVYYKDQLQQELIRNESFSCQNCSHLCFITDSINDCECPDGVEKRLLKGEGICDSEQEPPQEDPFICNCNDVDICTKSLHPACSCDSCSWKHNHTLSDSTSRLHQILDWSKTALIILLVVIPLVVLFILSFFKK